MGYVHWTFPDQTVEDQYPSYLMARRVRPLGDGVLKTTADDALDKLKGVVEAASAAAEKARLACVRCVNKAKKTFGEAYEVSLEGRPPREPTKYEIGSQFVGSSYRRRMEDTDEAALRPATQCVPALVEPEDVNRPAPSNVTPRGRGFTAKLARGGAVDYLGIFPDRRSAQAVYDKAAQEWKEKNGSDEEKLRPFSVPDPPLAALGRRDEWLARECPSAPIALRAAHLKSDSESNDADSLRARVASYLDQRVSMPPPDPYLSPRSRKRPLYNQVVRIIDKPPCYQAKYWFVYQYVRPRFEVWWRLHSTDTTRLQDFE